MSKRDVVALVRCMSTLQQRRPGKPGINLGHDSSTPSDPARASRRQHQLVSVENQHREAMRLLLDSLYAATGDCRAKTAPANWMSRILLGGQQQYLEQVSFSSQQTAQTSVLGAVPAVTEDEHNVNEKQSNTDINPSAEENDELGNAIKTRDIPNSIRLFEEAIANDQLVPQKHAVGLFFLVIKTDPITAYKCLQHSNNHPETTEFTMDMYRRLCYVSGALIPRKIRPWMIHNFFMSLLEDLRGKDLEVKKELYPSLTVSLAKQGSVLTGPSAGVLYNFLIENGHEVKIDWLRLLLSLSKYNRQEDLPFHDIIARLVEMKAEVHPLLILPAIHNMFPYTDSEKICVALEAYRNLLRGTTDGESCANPIYQEHVIDFATLEMISAGAAHSGNSKLILLVWDVLELCNYKPTEAIFENTIVTFAANHQHGLQQTFCALVSMKEEGFDISLPLTRSISRLIR